LCIFNKTPNNYCTPLSHLFSFWPLDIFWCRRNVRQDVITWHLAPTFLTHLSLDSNWLFSPIIQFTPLLIHFICFLHCDSLSNLTCVSLINISYKNDIAMATCKTIYFRHQYWQSTRSKTVTLWGIFCSNN